MEISEEILDNIVKQLCEGDTSLDNKSYANYDEDGIYIDASVMWHIESSPSYITIDGCSYLEGIYDEVTDFSNLQVDAWVKGEKVAVDLGYIEDKLSINL